MVNGLTRKLNDQLNTKNDALISKLEVLIIIALAVVLIYPPYLQGLFFEEHILPTGAYVFSLFIVFCIYKWLKNDFTLLITPIDYLSFCFIAVYFISLTVAVHTRSAIIELLKYCIYFSVFRMITDLANSIKIKLVLLKIIIVSAVGVSILGLDSANGEIIVKVINKLFTALGYEKNILFGLFVNGRVHSTLQYPNAMASYCMAVFFITIAFLTRKTKILEKIQYSFCAFLLLLTFILTQSSGATLIFPLGVIILVATLRSKEKITGLLYTISISIVALIISILIKPYLSNSVFNTKAFIYILGGSVVSILLSVLLCFIDDFLKKVSWKVYGIIAVVAVIFLSIISYYAVTNSSSLELSHHVGEEEIGKKMFREYSLIPGKKYILSYEAETYMEDEKPYIYSVGIISKSKEDILFQGGTTLHNQIFTEISGRQEIRIEFTVPGESCLIDFEFVNKYSGTGVILDNASILDSETGKIVKRIQLKNKYNLDNLIPKISNIRYDQTGLIRLIFYADGFRIFKNRWLIGGGGGAWEYLYRQYQSYNYTSSLPHNYLLQLGIETGIIGIIVLLLLLVSIFYIFSACKKKIRVSNGDYQDETFLLNHNFILTVVITPISTLFIHSLIDFDFSESAMLLLFWVLIAILNREAIDILQPIDFMPINLFRKTEKRKNLKKTNKPYMIIGSMIIAMCFFGVSCMFISARSDAKNAYQYLQENNIEQAIQSMKLATQKDKYNEKYIIGFTPIPSRPDLKVGLVDLVLKKNEMYYEYNENGQVTQKEQQVLREQLLDIRKKIDLIEPKSKNNIYLTINLASYCFSTGQTEKGIEYLNKAIQLCPFDQSLWQSKINLFYQLTVSSFLNNDSESAFNYLEMGLKCIQEAIEINHKNMNPFLFSDVSVDLLQKLKYISDHRYSSETLNLDEVIHYSLFDMDVNLDKITDQWIVNDKKLLRADILDGKLKISAQGRDLIYTNYLYQIEKDKTYRVEVKFTEPVEFIACYIDGIQTEILLTEWQDNKYITELRVKNEPTEIGHRIGIYLESDCTIENILVLEK